MISISYPGKTKVQLHRPTDGVESERLLNEVFSELEKERAKRSELETQICLMKSSSVFRECSKEVNVDRGESEIVGRSELETEAVISSLIAEVEDLKRLEAQRSIETDLRLKEESLPSLKQCQHRVVRLMAQRDGLRQVIEALTCDNDAIQLAKNSVNGAYSTLPTYAVRLLETVPWDERVQQYISFTEEVYEWQTLTASQGWTSNPKLMAPQLKSLAHKKRLREMMNQPDSANCDKFLSSSAFLTDSSATHLLDIEHDVPLPSRGTWKWIGGWRTGNDPDFPTDSSGWSYSDEPHHFLQQASPHCFDSPGSNDNDAAEDRPARTLRRRKWTRLRVLISYPSICKQTQHILAANAQNASLALTVDKLTGQLLDMQMKTMELEDQLAYSRTFQQNALQLQQQLNQSEQTIHKLNNKLIKCNTAQRKGLSSRFDFANLRQEFAQKLEHRDNILSPVFKNNLCKQHANHDIRSGPRKHYNDIILGWKNFGKGPIREPVPTNQNQQNNAKSSKDQTRTTAPILSPQTTLDKDNLSDTDTVCSDNSLSDPIDDITLNTTKQSTLPPENEQDNPPIPTTTLNYLKLSPSPKHSKQLILDGRTGILNQAFLCPPIILEGMDEKRNLWTKSPFLSKSDSDVIVNNNLGAVEEDAIDSTIDTITAATDDLTDASSDTSE